LILDGSGIAVYALPSILLHHHTPQQMIKNGLTGIQLMGHICPKAGDKLPTDNHNF
jgi:hypothetical protein